MLSAIVKSYLACLTTLQRTLNASAQWNPLVNRSTAYKCWEQVTIRLLRAVAHHHLHGSSQRSTFPHLLHINAIPSQQNRKTPYPMTPSGPFYVEVSQ